MNKEEELVLKLDEFNHYLEVEAMSDERSIKDLSKLALIKALEVNECIRYIIASKESLLSYAPFSVLNIFYFATREVDKLTLFTALIEEVSSLPYISIKVEEIINKYKEIREKEVFIKQNKLTTEEIYEIIKNNDLKLIDIAVTQIMEGEPEFYLPHIKLILQSRHVAAKHKNLILLLMWTKGTGVSQNFVYYNNVSHGSLEIDFSTLKAPYLSPNYLQYIEELNKKNLSSQITVLTENYLFIYVLSMIRIPAFKDELLNAFISLSYDAYCLKVPVFRLDQEFKTHLENILSTLFK